MVSNVAAMRKPHWRERTSRINGEPSAYSTIRPPSPVDGGVIPALPTPASGAVAVGTGVLDGGTVLVAVGVDVAVLTAGCSPVAIDV
jgi:hypothetical protein